MVILIFGPDYSKGRIITEKLREMRNKRRPTDCEVIDEENFASEVDLDKRYREMAAAAVNSIQLTRLVIVHSMCVDGKCADVLRKEFPSLRTVYVSMQGNDSPKGYDFYVDSGPLHEHFQKLRTIINDEIMLAAPIPKKRFYNGFSQRRLWMINYQYKFALPLVAKCASTQITEWNRLDNELYSTWHTEILDLPYNRFVGRFYFEQLEIPEGTTKFAIYRDPLERFYSACLYPGYDARDAIREFTEHIWRDGICKDQHMRRQSDFYNIDDVDYIVKLSDINDFLDIEFNFNTSMRNRLVHPKFEDMDLSLTDEQLQYVKDYYADDYKILESGKVWENPNKKETHS